MNKLIDDLKKELPNLNDEIALLLTKSNHQQCSTVDEWHNRLFQTLDFWIAYYKDPSSTNGHQMAENYLLLPRKVKEMLHNYVQSLDGA